MIRAQAIEHLTKLREVFDEADEKGCESVTFDAYEVAEDFASALRFAIEDMRSLQDIITITDGIMKI